MSEHNKHGIIFPLIALLASLSTMVYFPLVEILNTISITVNPNVYTIYNYFVFAASISAVMVVIIHDKGKIPAFSLKAWSLVLLIIAIYFVFSLFVKQESTYFIYFFLWSVPALMVGLYVPFMNNELTPKLLELLSTVMGASTLWASRHYLSIGKSHLNTLTFGGTNYQGLSYTAAFCMGVELYFTFLAPDDQHFQFFRTKIAKAIEVAVILISVFSVLVSGGRGGLILVVLNLIVFLFLLSKKNSYSGRVNRSLKGLGIILIGVMFILFLRQFSNNAIFSGSIDRLLSFINIRGDNSVWNAGRISIYTNSIDVITKNPVYGYGIFNLDATGGEPYAHNIILETWINAGFIYMLIWLVVLISLWRFLLSRQINDNNRYSWLIFFLTYTTVFLNASGTYLWCSELWFCIGIMFSSFRKDLLLNSE